MSDNNGQPAAGKKPPSSAADADKRGLLSLLWPFLKPYKWPLLAGAGFIAAGAAIEVTIPRLVGEAIDLLRLHNAESAGAKHYAFLLMVLVIIGGVCRFLMRQAVIGRSRHIEFDLRRTFYDKLLNLSPTFYDRERTGDIMERAAGDLEAVRMFLGPGLMHLTNTLFLLPLAVWMLVSINGWLTLAALAPFALLAVAVRTFGSRIYDRSKDVQDHLSLLSAMVQENLSGIRVVKAFSQEEAQMARFAAMNAENVRRALGLARVQAAFFPFLMMIASVGFLMVVWLGGYLVVHPNPTLFGFALGKITLGNLTTFTMLLGLLAWPCMALGWAINLYQRGSASMRRVAKVLEAESHVQENAGASDQRDLEASVEVRDLTFHYPNPPSIVADASGGKMRSAAQVASAEAAAAKNRVMKADPGDEPPIVLRDIDLTIEPGKILGIVGPIGSGKSTLAKLIARMYPVEDGKIFVGGVDVNSLTLEALRHQVGYVFQETFLFSANIADNIRYGRPDASDEEVARVAEIASLSGEIEILPKGYQTMLGERGINLSGGQKQRAAIARALLYDPKILILDDALSAVDAETEEKILHALHEANAERTVIIIAHRLSTLRDADSIIVLEKGQITESGSHEELIAGGGFYAKLHRMQQLEEEIAAATA